MCLLWVAMVFIDCMCQPSIQATLSRKVGTAPTVKRELLDLTAEEFAAVEGLMGSTGAAICSFESERLRPLGAEPPTPIERLIAEWQLGDPTSTGDAWRPWKRLNRSHRTRPASEGGLAPG